MVTVKDIIQKSCEDFILRVRSNMAANDLIVSGKTAASLQVEDVTDTADQVKGGVSGASYFSVTEDGRRPGKRPPVASIIPWILSRGLHTQWKMSAYSAAFIVARSIGEEGSKLYRLGGRKDIYTSEVNRTTEELIKSLGKYYAGIITTKINDVSRNIQS